MSFKQDSIVRQKSFDFAVRIVRLYRHLCEDRKEFVLSKQLLRAGTSVGANIHEALHGQTRRDFGAKMNISLKEISETEYWLNLLHATDYLTDSAYQSIHTDCVELLKILTAISKTVTPHEN